MATLTLYRKTKTGFDSGTAVAHGLATGGLRKSAEGELRLSVQTRTWHLWMVEAGDPPKIDDVLQDENGERWVIDEVEVLTLGTRYRVRTTKETP